MTSCRPAAAGTRPAAAAVTFLSRRLTRIARGRSDILDEEQLESFKRLMADFKAGETEIKGFCTMAVGLFSVRARSRHLLSRVAPLRSVAIPIEAC